jgi:hypothetical protein
VPSEVGRAVGAPAERFWSPNYTRHSAHIAPGVEYDRPSSLFGQFGNASLTEVATMLDRKLEQPVAEAIR